MKSVSATQNVLSELLKINRVRVAGYKKASDDTDDSGLKAMFLNMADQGRKNITDILQEILEQNGSAEITKTSATEKIYGAWATFKTRFSKNNIKSVLNSCESMETATLQIYQKPGNKSFGVRLTKLVEKHELSLKSSHEVIRVYRQAYLKLDKLYS